MAVINGTAGADTLTGTAGDDEIKALAGNDVIKGSTGADKIDGGTGTDTVDYSASAQGINVDVRQGVGLVGRGGDAEGDTLSSVESMIGSAYNDTFTVGRFTTATTIRLDGGNGDDIYFIDNGATPIITEQTGGGDDEVRVSVVAPSGTTLAANIERLTFVGDKNFKGYGNDINNIITGGSGNDTLYGGAGADRFIGGAGNDTAGYLDSKVGVTINLKTGVHTGIAAGDTYSGIETISGSNFNDTFVGNGNGISFNGGTGTDTVDYSTSTAGVNVDVRQSTGNVGTGGDAEGTTLTSIETILGSAYNDTFTVGPFTTATTIRLDGGAGNDIYYINNGATPIITEQVGGGDDEVRVSVVAPSGTTLAANIERLTFVGDKNFKGYGNDSNNIITGGSGNDTLYGGAGADRFIGGAGNDTAGYLDSKVGVTINLKTGVHTGIAAGDTYSGIETISGSNFNDTFVGNGNGISFNGGTGTDTVDYSASTAGVNIEVRAGAGAVGTGGDAEGTTLTNIENVIGSAFNDTFTSGYDGRSTAIRFEGGAGNDIYYVNTTNTGITPTIVELAGGGDDEVRVSVPHASATLLAANIERLTFVGDKNFTGYGNDSNNIITGGSGNDTLYGGAGADRFIGGAGNDTAGYLDSKVGVTINLKTGVHTGIAAGDTYSGIETISGSNFNDTFVGNGNGISFNGGTGTDTVDYSASTAGVNIEVRAGAGAVGTGGDAEGTTLTNIENVIGSAFNDTFTSGYDGRSTAIRFEGGAGNDIYYVNTTNTGITPTIVELAGGGDDEVRVSVPHASATLLAANIERLTFVGDKNFTGYGNDSNYIITGGSGNDTLYGGAGADRFIGGDGYDTAGYLDSTVAMTLNLKTGVYSGIAAGDTYTGIEVIAGSKFNDTFYAGTSPMGLNGESGQDLVTYQQSTSAVTLDLATPTANTGDAAGDTYTAIEIFRGSNFNDTLSGSRLAETFIGGTGADVIDGREGLDSAWYITSATAVTINLQTQVNKGGDAEGDVLTNIERVVGSHFNDTLTGDAATNYLEGGLGSDVIRGGDGNDYLYGGLTSQIGPFTLAGQTNGPQADTLYGGNGNDTIVTAASDQGSRAYGEAGGDVITVASAMADGGEGDDLLTGTGLDFSLLGGAGDDRLVLKSSGWANGGQGDDVYTVDTPKLVTIQDDGTSKSDTLILSYINTYELRYDRVGDDLYLHRSVFATGETPQEGVRLKDWYAGYNTIEQIQTADGQLITLAGINSEASLMFG